MFWQIWHKCSNIWIRCTNVLKWIYIEDKTCSIDSDNTSVFFFFYWVLNLHAIYAIISPCVTALWLNVAVSVVVRSRFFTPGGRGVSTAGCDSVHNAEAAWRLWPWKNRLDKQKASSTAWQNTPLVISSLLTLCTSLVEEWASAVLGVWDALYISVGR